MLAGHSLSYEQSVWAMDSIMSGLAGEAQLGALLMGLAAKGETVEEVAGFSDAMRRHARPLGVSGESLDIVGTGGDQLNTVNISTMSMIAASAAGAPIVKHGNRSASSMSGSADVLEALGVSLEAPASDVEGIFREVGIAFVFAQVFHPSMRFAAAARKQMGVPTIFNVLGPLTNPAHPAASAIGTPKETTAELIAGVLARRGSRGLVFRGQDGLDELTVTAPSTVWEVRDGEVRRCEVEPAQLGLGTWTIADLTGGDARHNADVARRTLAGEEGAPKDAVLLNAAAGLVAFDAAADGSLESRLRDKIERVREVLENGQAIEKLEAWVECSQAAAQRAQQA
ncbi:anthranilate phosphoribosyltransferase [Arthrobacter sp. UM1]|nr:anthranilate phosphoribosyltransferase [Arthrobacter sp. UM1]